MKYFLIQSVKNPVGISVIEDDVLEALGCEFKGQKVTAISEITYGQFIKAIS